MRILVAALCVILLNSCAESSQDAGDAPQMPRIADSAGAKTDSAQPAPPPATQARQIRLSGVLEAVRSSRIGVPQLSGNIRQLTLTRLVPNGTEVQEGDLIARFDPTQQVDDARMTSAQFDDLSHQVAQKGAENRVKSEERRAKLQQAEADLRKAELGLGKEDILADIAVQQNKIQFNKSQEQVESLQKSNTFHDEAEAAALRILELKRDRQKVALERAQTNLDKLELRAPISGMVAHEVFYRNGSMIHPQEGDQLYRGNALVKIFDPSEMLVVCKVGEPDGDLLKPGMRAMVYFDAYPDLVIPAHFETSSPIATSALGTPIKTFSATFRLDQPDPRLMPDLSAAVVIETEPEPETEAAPAQ